MSDAWQLPPFPPDVRQRPGGYSLRIAEGYPLGMDPLGWAMAVPCGADVEQLHGDPVDLGPGLDLQLDALACDYVHTYPGDHPERVRWLESARYVDVDVAAWRQMLNQEITFEVARLDAPVAGALRIEEIATYLRLVEEEGGATTLLVGNHSDNASATITEPFAFPLTFSNGPLTWVWDLVEEMVGITSPGPEWANGVERARAVPATSALRAPWTDNRYAWGNRWGGDHQLTVGGKALVRLFVTLHHPQPDRDFVAVRVGGGLRGFNQQTGRREAAVQNATIRS